MALNMKGIEKLYAGSITSTRKGALFNAHSYPTKINPYAITPFILTHTRPGDVVFDGFAGSGATGIATLLCDSPDRSYKELIEKRLGPVEWGSRDCVLYDISELACFISKILTSPLDSDAFFQAASEIIEWLDSTWGWMYKAKDNEGVLGEIRHLVWTEYIICPTCGDVSSFWDLGVTISPPSISSTVKCGQCGVEYEVKAAERQSERYFDDLIDEQINGRMRRPVYIYGKTGKRYWSRRVTSEDSKLIQGIRDTKVPSTVPVVRMLDREGRWGELYRSGYHYGISHLHHFYTRRNLIAVAAAWEKVDEYPEPTKQALRFWISSYTASHSTLMSRIVAKAKAKYLVVTGAQPGVLYISSLPVEKNVFAGLLRKMSTVRAALELIQNAKGKVEVYCASSSRVHLHDSSVDYVFTDPPFGGNIQYSEVNFISESWLGETTKPSDETIISAWRNKSVEDYHELLFRGFLEIHRILKPSGCMTLAFHSANPSVWSAVQSAWEKAGFKLVKTAILDKTQTSFKQTTTRNAVQYDPLVLLRKFSRIGPSEYEQQESTDVSYYPSSIIEEILQSIPEDALSSERSKRKVFTRFVNYHLERGQKVPMNAKAFYHMLEANFDKTGESYYSGHGK